ncbi:MAG: ureidoglycolate lyase [Acidimicrobiia bacterium]|nr:ureidoglycolate lyase [Acidimicrobiia bacterium]
MQALSREAFAPFGWLPSTEGDEHDKGNSLAFAWADAHLNYIAHRADEIERTPGGAVVDRLYRHATHTQALMPINTDAVFVVAPAGTGFTSEADVHSLRGFVVHPLDVVVLDQGTWHWGPFPVGDEPVRLLNLQGRRYQEDNDSVDPGLATGVRVVMQIPRPRER